MKYLVAALSVVVIASLNLTLLVGAGIQDPGSRPFFGGLVTAMDLALVSSSALLGLRFLRRGNRPLAALFALSLGLFGAAFVVVASGRRLHPLAEPLPDLPREALADDYHSLHPGPDGTPDSFGRPGNGRQTDGRGAAS
jgi:hypothetical protein